MNIFKHKRILLPLLVISLLCALYVYSKLSISPPQDSQTSNNSPISPQDSRLTQLTPTQIKFSFSASFPEMPNRLPVYSSQNSYVDIPYFAATIANRFNLKQSSLSDSIWNSSDNSLSLVYDKYNHSLIYTASIYQIPTAYSGPKNPTQEQAIQTTKQLVASFSELSNLQIDTQKIVPRKVNHDAVVDSSINEAELFEIPLIQSVNGYPIFFDSQTFPALLVWIAQNNQVVKFTYSPQSLKDINEVDNKPTISNSEASKLLENGKATLINITSEEMSSLEKKQLPPLTVTDIELQYRFNSSSKLLIPYYLFTTQYQSAEKITKTAYFILPAIEL